MKFHSQNTIRWIHFHVVYHSKKMVVTSARFLEVISGVT